MLGRRRRKTDSPIAVLTRGVGAGVVGTTGMTALQELTSLVSKARSNDSSPEASDESGRDEDPWSKAPAPAQVAKRVLEAVFRRQVDPDRIGLLTNMAHWGYGTSLGVGYGLIQGRLPFRAKPLVAGPVYGLAAWAQSYAMLVPMGLYEPPWRYPARTVAKDVSYHLAFGLSCAAGHSLLSRR
jgi:hypothetical protein